MNRLASTLVAIAGLILPVLSVIAHTHDELAVSLLDQETVVTGHEESDPALHIERPSGVRVQRCPGCVLDKRQSAPARSMGPISKPRSADRHLPADYFEPVSSEIPSYRSPRAPPSA